MDHSLQLDFMNLALLWCIGLVGVIVAINSRGPVRLGFSWFLAVLILITAFFVSTLKFSAFKDQWSSTPATPAVVPVQEPAPAPVQEVVKVEPENTENIQAWLTEARQIVLDGQTSAYAISTFDVEQLAQLTDVQYERMESRARSLRNQTSNLNRQTKKLSPTPKVAAMHDSLVKASDNLRLAGYGVHAYFGAEDANQEAAFQNQFLRHSRLAISTLKNIQESLENLP